MRYKSELKIGKNLRALRITANFTQDELGARVGVSGVAVSLWESDSRTPTLSKLDEIAKTLKVPITKLLGR